MQIVNGVLTRVDPADITDGTFIFPDEVNAIGNRAFKNCHNLEELTIPERIKHVGEYAFNECGNLRKVTVHQGVVIDDYAFFYCLYLEELIIHRGVTIGNHAFRQCPRLSRVTLEQGVARVGDYAFYMCGNIEQISTAEGLTYLGKHALEQCNRLTHAFIKRGIESIDELTFHNCTKLAVVMLPIGITFVHPLAFSGCPELKTIIIDTCDETEHQTIKNLLSERLRERVMSVQMWKRARELQTEALIPLLNRPEINRFYRIVCNEIALPEPFYQRMNRLFWHDNPYCKNARSEMYTLFPPVMPDVDEPDEVKQQRFEKECDEYKDRCHAIALKHAKTVEIEYHSRVTTSPVTLFSASQAHSSPAQPVQAEEETAPAP